MTACAENLSSTPEYPRGANASSLTTDKPASQEYSVSGLVVHSLPEKSESVAARLRLLTGVEVHLINPDGKMVVTVEEEPGQKLMVDTITAINNTEGVINAALVYARTEIESQTDSDAASNSDSEEQQ
ncbi:MAG: chaperone NapD [Hahellaceae bacterium]|nr:chaperone NapD [Hahellaceae bacterium]MCP5168305.1 chaperone NapD [Hahellaceae bacterium]